MLEETFTNEEFDTDEQDDISKENKFSHLKPWQYKKGQTGNPLGRYLGGKSGKERMKEKIANMTEEEFEEFLEGQNKNDMWQMGEGRPASNIDMNVKDERKPLTDQEKEEAAAFDKWYANRRNKTGEISG